MHKPKKLEILDLETSTSPFTTLPDTQQKRYILSYLRGLSATTIIVEQNYFDRDYLAEFSAFYSVSAQGYSNICQRIHIFSSPDINRDNLESALKNHDESVNLFQESYLGFIVIRPLIKSPFGRTVLKGYEHDSGEGERICEPYRTYECNLFGLKLSVYGLAWQQQDTGVSACATVGLWTMFHSSAFDARHAIPTTADITNSAHLTTSGGYRPFPQKGLRVEQIYEAINQHNLVPMISSPDLRHNNATCFSPGKFSSTCSSFIRSGYPVAIIGHYKDQPSGHMICAVSFRENNSDVSNKSIDFIDCATNIFYIHDDNIGPNVRWRLTPVSSPDITLAALVTEPPAYIERGEPIDTFTFIPNLIIAAAHEDIRLTFDEFHQEACTKVNYIYQLLFLAYQKIEQPMPKLTFGSRFIKGSDFLKEEVARIFKSAPDLMAQVRLNIAENVSPMSNHIGIVRIALAEQSTTLIDIIYDTTDSDRNTPVLAHIVYDKSLEYILQNFLSLEDLEKDFGVQIKGCY
ncbi:MAG: hypothetical protein ACRBCI_14230 [Cellvibrionaceae bacterium]